MFKSFVLSVFCCLASIAIHAQSHDGAVMNQFLVGETGYTIPCFIRAMETVLMPRTNSCFVVR